MRLILGFYISLCPRTAPVFATALVLCACAPKREFVQFDRPHLHPVPSQLTATGKYDSRGFAGPGVPNEGIPPMYSHGGPAHYGILVDGPRHSPYVSPQYRILDIPFPLPPGRRIQNRTDAPIILRDGHPDRYNQILIQDF